MTKLVWLLEFSPTSFLDGLYWLHNHIIGFKMVLPDYTYIIGLLSLLSLNNCYNPIIIVANLSPQLVRVPTTSAWQKMNSSSILCIVRLRSHNVKRTWPWTSCLKFRSMRCLSQNAERVTFTNTHYVILDVVQKGMPHICWKWSDIQQW